MNFQINKCIYSVKVPFSPITFFILKVASLCNQRNCNHTRWAPTIINGFITSINGLINGYNWGYNPYKGFSLYLELVEAHLVRIKVICEFQTQMETWNHGTSAPRQYPSMPLLSSLFLAGNKALLIRPYEVTIVGSVYPLIQSGLFS